MKILLISDIHANFPALAAIEDFFSSSSFDYIINCGDSLVYGPFPNETLTWLKQNRCISILGNTDKKVKKLLQGKSFKKPSKKEKRVMYSWTAEKLDKESCEYLFSMKKRVVFPLTNPSLPSPLSLGIYHGSPAEDHEFLFFTTPDERFEELAKLGDEKIVVFGHSHDPFHKHINGKHFINPGSVGRMFDGKPEASCCVIDVSGQEVETNHYRIAYDIQATIKGIRSAGLPEIYCQMFLIGKKLN